MHRSCILPAILAVLTASCAPSDAPAAQAAQTTQAAGVIDPFAHCTGEDRRACLAEVERREIAKAGGRVRRQGTRLLIRPESAPEVELASDTSDSGRHESFVYGGYLPSIRHHVAMVQYYEGGSVVLVHAVTGGTTYLYGWPAISPDSQRVAAASVDLVAGHDENGIQVWRATETHLRLEWTLDGGEVWGASNPAWRGADVLGFTRETMPSPAAHPDEVVRTPMCIVLRGEGFSLEPDSR